MYEVEVRQQGNPAQPGALGAYARLHCPVARPITPSSCIKA